MTTKTRPQWRVPTALLALTAVPVVAGAVRMGQLTAGARITEDNARYFASPVPIMLHIVGVTVFCVLGAFQFVPRLRRGGWHRMAGRVTLLCGLVAALSGLWMALFYPLPAADHQLITAFRLVFGAMMAGALVLAFTAIRRRDVVTHRAWMVRAYAIGVGAGSQAVIMGFWVGFAGTPAPVTRALLLAAGWVLNLAVAEHIIGRSRKGSR